MNSESQFHLPEDPLRRFHDIYSAINRDAKWWSSHTCLRYSALALTTMEGSANTLGRELWRVGEKLRRGGGWTSPVVGSIRFLIAAALMRNGQSTDRFFAEAERAHGFFREAKLPRGRANEMLATIILQKQAANDGSGRIRREQVQRLQQIFLLIKADHPWLTASDDYPCAALLAGSHDSPRQITTRVENLYQGLRQFRFSKGNSLQTVSQMLYLNPEADHQVLRRFQNLYQAFKDQGLWMYEGDYDEIACLTFLDNSTSEIVNSVIKHRETIIGQSKWIGKNETFSLACHTSFLQLIGDAKHLHWLVDLISMIQVQSILQAQQAAAASAAT